jgi:hypothetical protein
VLDQYQISVCQILIFFLYIFFLFSEIEFLSLEQLPQVLSVASPFGSPVNRQPPGPAVLAAGPHHPVSSKLKAQALR